MRYSFLIVMVLQAGTAVACETQSDVQADDDSTTVMKRDCADQVAPAITPRKELPAIPSVGVKVNPDASPRSIAPVNPVMVDPKPKVVAITPAKRSVPHRTKAVTRRVHASHAQKSKQRPMFWWHIRK